MQRKTLLCLLGILFLAVFFRFWQLGSFPPGVFQDEAVNTMDALNNPGQPFYPANNGREGLFMNLIALSFKFFGVNTVALRLVSAIIGTLTVLGIYFLGKELTKKENIGLWSSLFVALSFWHINFSRISFRVIMLPFAIVWFLYFLIKAFNRKLESDKTSWWDLAASGFFFGLGFYTYTTFRLTGVLLLFFVLLYYLIVFIKKKEFKSFFGQCLFFGLIGIIVLIPLISYFVAHPADFFGRTSQVMVFAQENPIKALFDSLGKHLAMFNFHGDWNWRHNIAGAPQLEGITGFFFLIGIILSLGSLIFHKKRDPQEVLGRYILLMGFACGLLPAVLTAEGAPHALRTMGCLPFAFIFAGVGMNYAVEKINATESKQKFSWLYNSLAALVVIILIITSFYGYFMNWAQKKEVHSAFASDFVDFGELVNKIDSNINVYIIFYGGNSTYDAETIRFIEATKYKKTGHYQYFTSDEFEKYDFQNKGNNAVVALGNLGNSFSDPAKGEEMQGLAAVLNKANLTSVVFILNDAPNEYIQHIQQKVSVK